MRRKSKNHIVNFIKKYKSQLGKPISIQMESSRGSNQILTYIKLTNNKIKKTVEIEKNKVYIDYDRKNNIVGLEIL